MMRLKTASLAVLGTAAIAISVLASPAMAEGKMKGTAAKGAQAQTEGTQTLVKGKRQASSQSQRVRRANAAVPAKATYRRPAGPVDAAGKAVGGAVATAGATAPFRAADNNYYGQGYRRDWKTYAARNNLTCAPGATFKGADGKPRPCQ